MTLHKSTREIEQFNSLKRRQPKNGLHLPFRSQMRML